MIEYGIALLLVIVGILCAIVVIAMSAIRAVRGSGDSLKFVWAFALAVLLVVAKFDVDPTAVECPDRQSPPSSPQDPPRRCTVGNALASALAGGSIGIGKTLVTIPTGGLFTEAGRATTTTDLSRDVKRLSPVVAGFILVLAVGLGFAKPFGTAVIAMKGGLRRWGAGILVTLAFVGTLPWAIGILMSYLGLLFWPAALPVLWLSGLAMGLLWALVSIKDALRGQVKHLLA
jgi:hypothetical protein